MIVLTNILANEINVGYEWLENSVVVSANGEKISTIRNLVSAIENNKKRYHTIVTKRGKQIVLDRKELNKISKQILDKYNIDLDRSEDLKDIL